MIVFIGDCSIDGFSIVGGFIVSGIVVSYVVEYFIIIVVGVKGYCVVVFDIGELLFRSNCFYLVW